MTLSTKYPMNRTGMLCFYCIKIKGRGRKDIDKKCMQIKNKPLQIISNKSNFKCWAKCLFWSKWSLLIYLKINKYITNN